MHYYTIKYKNYNTTILLEEVQAIDERLEKYRRQESKYVITLFMRLRDAPITFEFDNYDDNNPHQKIYNDLMNAWKESKNNAI